MYDSILVIDRDYCFLTNMGNKNVNKGLILRHEFCGWYCWVKNKYVSLSFDFIEKSISEKIHFIHYKNNKNPIPVDTEILINFGFDINKNLPENIKIYFSENYENIHDLIFPIGLKYLCLRKNGIITNLINKIKILFDCKIILLGS